MEDVLRKRVEEALSDAEKSGIKVRPALVYRWFEDKLNAKVSLDLAFKKLKEAKYDINRADALFGKEGEVNAEIALAKVEELKDKIEKKEKEEKRVNLLTYVISAALLSGVAAYSAITINKAISGISDKNIAGMGFVDAFVKAAWAACVLGAIAAVVLAAIFFYELKKGSKK